MPEVKTSLLLQMAFWSLIILIANFINFVPSQKILDNLVYFYAFSILFGISFVFVNKRYLIDAYRFRTNEGRRHKRKIMFMASVGLIVFIFPIVGAFTMSTNTLPSLITLAIGKHGSEVFTVASLSSRNSGHKGRGTHRKYVEISEGLFPSSRLSVTRISHTDKIKPGDKINANGKKSWAGIFPQRLEVLH